MFIAEQARRCACPSLSKRCKTLEGGGRARRGWGGSSRPSADAEAAEAAIAPKTRHSLPFPSTLCTRPSPPAPVAELCASSTTVGALVRA
jgi:hypothetical protein